jgi:Tol biopolymer transport system component
MAEGGIAWAPDGRRLAFDRSYRCGRHWCSGVYVFDLATRQRARRVLADASAPAWSGDGRELAFERGGGQNAEIWRADADGSHQVRLTHNHALDSAPVWRWPH